MLTTLFQGDCFIPSLTGSTKPEVLRQMALHLANSKRIPTDLLPTVETALISREEKLTTAIGGGLALPHASIHGLSDVVAVAGRHPAGIDYGASDHLPVHLLFMVLVPANDYATHLRTLALLSRFFSGDEARQTLAALTTREQFCELIRNS